MSNSMLSRALMAAAIAGLVLTGCSGTTTAGPAGSPAATTGAAAPATEHNDADVTFAQNMIGHHRQAVEMAGLAAGRAENPQVLDLATRIGGTQEPEIATMTGWLQQWGAEVPEGDGMAGMDHGSMGGGMGGMMTPGQMQALEQASGATFDGMFLEMMIEHHRGAIEQARTELDEGAAPEAKQLAQTIITNQQGELTEMQSLLGQS